MPVFEIMNNIAIIHNIPISYKHLLFSELARIGLDFEVLFIASDSAIRLEGPDLASAPYRSRIGFQGSAEAVPWWRAVRFVWCSLSEIQPNVVIISGWSGGGPWAARLWCIVNRRPGILWVESNEFDRPRVFWKELVKAAFLKGLSAAQVYGTTNAEYLIKLGFETGKIWSKRAVADVERFRLVEDVEPRGESRKVVLFVGRLAPEKNLEFVLEVVHRLPFEARRRLLLRFIGHGPLDAHLRRRADILGLDDCVEFGGPCKHSHLPEVYHSADVLLLPSTSEPWGLTVNEGMLCGLPAIVSHRCGCARDLILPDTGWVFDPYDRTGFGLILERVAAMPADGLRVMGKRAAALSRNYSPENCAKVVMQCIRAVAPAVGESR